MPLARLKCHSQGSLTVHIYRHTYNSSRNVTLIFCLTGKEGRMRATVSHWDSEPLGRSHGTVGTHISRLFNIHQCHWVTRNCNLLVQFLVTFTIVCIIHIYSVFSRILQQLTKILVAELV